MIMSQNYNNYQIKLIVLNEKLNISWGVRGKKHLGMCRKITVILYTYDTHNLHNNILLCDEEKSYMLLII